MKNRLTILCTILFSILTVSGISQSTPIQKSPHFDNSPKVISCSTSDLNQFFLAAKGQPIQSTLSKQFNINGATVSNNFKQSNNFQSVAIKLADYDGAILSISKRLDENNNTVFVGHIIHQFASDGYELRKTNDGSYQFVKVNMEDILPTCSQK